MAFQARFCTVSYTHLDVYKRQEKWLRILLRAMPRDPTGQERTMARSTRAQGARLRIEVRITEEEKAIIRDQANSASLTMSEYIRRTALNKRILSTMDQKAARCV